MGKYLRNKFSKEIITDDEFSPSKVAILENGSLVEYLCLLGPEVPQLGSIHIARVHQVFRQHRLATAEIENGVKISVRLSNEKIKSGDLIFVTISTEPWGSKPARAVLGAQIAGKYVILLPGRPDISRMSNRSIVNNTPSISLMEEFKKLIPKDYGLILRRRAIFEEKRLIENEVDTLLGDFQENADYPRKLELMTDPKKIFSGLSNMKPILVAMFTWSDFFNWNFNSIFIGLAQTLGMAFLGTFLASLVCIPISFLASRQIFKLGLIRFLIKRFLDIIRGVDILIWAIIYVRAFGLGPFAGLLSIFTVDVGTLGKLFSEAADNADTRQIEGMQSTGASKISVIRYGLIPQIFPIFISQSLYFFESNTRSAVILGVVGAGGIGLQLTERMKAQYWDQTLFIIILILIMVAIIDSVSRSIRKKIIDG